ncbi:MULTISPECIES: AraC family transcriptional regulator [Microbacterium]|jgi:AraC-like DNA-binding protein|uniref:helix-turn-helix transcriptional regulator n=1 Tax=Microbacterium TaxID=33882 RepID=UPI0023DA8D6D|nr:MULTISPECIES: AraC family transcriptional regulator [Microbacterium]MDF2046275.1 AraC family transcriptional regulator [Microbacterium sp. Kw_RZR3]MDF2918263.1 AraC family transcriptional regulator [Microbacterium sp.]MDQ1076568.1 AraC-like DNA-binding protein [Microbacterium sp. SORGH_AS_0969]MDQ1116805.1 AraC-like DNA-binding protein [Microbacterium testaceum]
MSESPRLESIEIVTPADAGERWPTHDHPDHELLSSITGVVTVSTERAVFVVPRGAAIWIPARASHEVHASAGNTMRCTWFARGAVPDALVRPTLLTTSTLLDDVLTHLDVEHSGPAGTTERAGERRARAESFALDLLSVGARPDAGFAHPRTPWLRRVTHALAADPGDPRTVEEWARHCAVSTRTFTRRFRDETGEPFSRWRSRLRMQAAMAALAAGQAVGVVAHRVGYDSAAAFSTAFREAAGVSPREFAAR